MQSRAIIVSRLVALAAGLALLDDANAGAQLTTLGVSAAAKTILDDASVADICTTLGVGSGDSVTFVNVTAPGDVNVGGNVNSNHLVKATCAGADAGGGGTTALLSVQLNKIDGTSAISAARQVVLIANSAQYSQNTPVPNASLSLGTVTAGSVISGSQGVWLVETNASGLFACTATNTDDETVYWSVCNPAGGVSDITKSCVVVGSNSDASTWSA